MEQLLLDVHLKLEYDSGSLDVQWSYSGYRFYHLFLNWIFVLPHVIQISSPLLLVHGELNVGF